MNNDNEILKALRCTADNSDGRYTECNKHEDENCVGCPYSFELPEINFDETDFAERTEIICDEAADLIERLQKQLEAAKLEIPRDCVTCANARANSLLAKLCPYFDDCNQIEGDHWEWRGIEVKP